MKSGFFLFIILSIALLCATEPAHSTVKNSQRMEPVGKSGFSLIKGKLFDQRDVATMSVQEHYSAGIKAMESKNWRAAVAQFRIVSVNFPDTPFGQDAMYYLGVGYMHISDYDLANKAFSKYLRTYPSGKHADSALRQKIAVAQAFQKGAKRHLFNTEYMPKWLPSKGRALELYEEVLDLSPSYEIAAEALFQKGKFLYQKKKYPECVDICQQLILRFPKQARAPACFLLIARAYYWQCHAENNNPDLLPLAEVNLVRLREAFPRHEYVARAEQKLKHMKEIYATGLYDTARFYERIKKPEASVLYYISAARRFPDTTVAQACRNRLENLDEPIAKLGIKKEAIL